jgi:hypothetical protein
LKTAPGVTQSEIPDSGLAFREPGSLSNASLMLATESRPLGRLAAFSWWRYLRPSTLQGLMLLGHYGVAFGAKRLVPRTSLGTLFFAAQFLDELWPVLLLLGVEQVRVVPGLMRASPLDFVSYPISHSLLMAVVWGALIGGTYGMRRRDRRGGLILGLLVVSHWLLDLPMHRPDLPLWPESSVKVGLGAWNSIPLTIVLELTVFGLGLASYLRTTRARDRVGTWGLWAMVALLVLIFASGFGTAAPMSQQVIGLTALGLWLFVPWAAWVDRHRAVTSGAGSL